MSKKFTYIYCAPTEEERTEIERIRRRYLPREQKQTDLERLYALDKKVNSPPAVISIIIGVAGLLLLGFGLTMMLEWGKFVPGIIVGIVGCVPVGLAYPSYKWISARQEKKYGKEILELSDKLLNENKSE